MNNLKKTRMLAEKTQTEVAKSLNLTQATYANYELGKTDPDIDTLIKLAKYFHTTIDNLVGYEVPYLLDLSTLTDTQKSIVKSLKNLNEVQCQRVLAYIEGINGVQDLKQMTINKFYKGE